MKFFEVNDSNNVTHYVNPQYIVEITVGDNEMAIIRTIVEEIHTNESIWKVLEFFEDNI